MRLNFALFLAALLLNSAANAATPRPKLVVLVVFDQFRSDYLTRFESRFLAPTIGQGQVGGFRYLMEKGAYYPMAQHQVLQNMTCPGHATLLTGAFPYRAGIPLNHWFDGQTGKISYCVEDPDAPLVGAAGKPEGGRSPKNLLASTFGDELKNAGYPSRVVSIALKDRAAILMGGHRADQVLWLDKDSYQWISSRYYQPDGKLPDWVIQLNSEIKKEGVTPYLWKSEGPGTGFSNSESFQHDLMKGNSSGLMSPIGPELTVQAAIRARNRLHLGEGQGTDLLAVSFSTHDYGGHAYGPNSREMEELTVAEDKTLSTFLNHLKKSLPGGLENTVIVLTGDHGAPPAADWLQANRINAGRIDTVALTNSVNMKLNDAIGKPPHGEWISQVIDFNFYLNHNSLHEKKVELEKAENLVKEVLLKAGGVQSAFSSSDFRAGRLPPGILRRKIEATYVPGKSGDVILLPLPYFYPSGSDKVDHLTFYNYDSSVPLIFSGFHIRPGQYAQQADIVDLAPTLSFLSGTIFPNMSEGRVLSEILKQSTISHH